MSRCPDRKRAWEQDGRRSQGLGECPGYADVGTMTWKEEVRVAWQKGKHPRSSHRLILRVRLGTRFPGASSSNIIFASKSASSERVSMAIPEQSTNSKNC